WGERAGGAAVGGGEDGVGVEGGGGGGGGGGEGGGGGDGGGGDGGGGDDDDDGIGDVSGFASLDGGTLTLTGTAGDDDLTFADEEIDGRAVLAFTRVDDGGPVTARYFADDVEIVII